MGTELAKDFASALEVYMILELAVAISPRLVYESRTV